MIVLVTCGINGMDYKLSGPTRWSSHFTFVSRLIDMFGSTCTLLEKLSDMGLSVLGISNILYCALQIKSQDILNALNLVSTTKLLLQHMVSFCERHNIDMPNMGERYIKDTRRSC
ncbi:hypothetical protein ACOSP7_004422 [Xanthoceras sorbifolium]